MRQRTDLVTERGRAFMRCLVFFASSTVLLWVGCQNSGPSAPNQTTASTPVILSPGDTIKLVFPGAGELSQSQKIRADGKVTLPIIGEVSASGKTVVELQTELTRLYKPQLRNSEVLLTIESGTANVIVSGFVGKPGKFSFDRPTTVFQAIMEAGGVSQYGRLTNVHLVRTVNGQQHTEVIDLAPAMRGRPTPAHYVKDGDVIYVGQKLF